MAYIPPKGIPNPSAYFGWEIDRPTPSWPASWTAGTPSPTAGYYFVDNSDPSATDSGNPYGNPDLPRLTPPSAANGSLAAGSFVYFHGGTYTSTYFLSSRGTTGSPIWWTGNPVTRPVFQGAVLHMGANAVGAAWWIIENLSFTNAGRFDLRPNSGNPAENIEYILIRNCDMTGTGSTLDSNAIAVGGDDNAEANYVVVYDCDISEYGDAEEPVLESEEAGVYADYKRSYTWVLDCTMWGIGGDCIAGSHSANATTKLSQHLYIGRNTLANPNPALLTAGENAIDLKSTRYVVISENIIHGTFGREQGWGIVIHSGSNPVPVRDCWIIFNQISHCSSGIIGTSTSGTQDVGIIGNVFFDIRAAYAAQPDPAMNGWAIGYFVTQGTGNFIAHNTVYGSDRGFTATNLSPSNTISSLGNILNQITDESLSVASGVEAYFVSDFNLFDSAAEFFWNNGTRNLAYMQSTGGVELNSSGGDPDFTDAGNDDFTLLVGSPAIDVGTEGGAYAAFLAIFGQSIQFDFDGNARPQNGDWDTGAFEYTDPSAAVLNITTLNATTLTVG